LFRLLVSQNLIMDKSLQEFDDQLSIASKYFPNLRVKTKEGHKILKGIIDIENSEHQQVQSFLIEIHYSTGFPYRFPRLYEVGGDIPCDVDWHKYDDNSCCLTVLPDEILQCKNGITVTQFINKNVIPYLANQCYKKLTGRYKDEFPHGKEGLIVYYKELMLTQDQNKWMQYAKYAFGVEKLKTGRNEPCICGSGMKMKKCHSVVFQKLQQIGENNVMKHLSILL